MLVKVLLIELKDIEDRIAREAEGASHQDAELKVLKSML
jgi:hypothetical protein